jgi:hypothetical protein
MFAAGAVVWIELRRDATRAERDRADHVRQIAAWPGTQGPNGTGNHGYWVRNSSDLPIYGLTIELRPIRDETSSEVVRFPSLVLVLEPGDRFFMPPNGAGIKDEAEEWRLFPELEFLDCSSQTWTRDVYGRLNRAGTRPPMRGR